MKEPRAPLIARRVVGALLLLESLVLLVIAGGVAIIGGLTGSLAFLAGAGNATDEQIARGFAMLALTLVTPFVVAALIGMGGVLLLFGRLKFAIVAAGVVALAAQGGIHLLTEEGFQTLELLPVVLHLSTIVLAIAFVPAPAATASV